jgi:hypothetical protein
MVRHLPSFLDVHLMILRAFERLNRRPDPITARWVIGHRADFKADLCWCGDR